MSALDDVRELAIELALPLDVALRVKQHIAAAVQAERAACLKAAADLADSFGDNDWHGYAAAADLVRVAILARGNTSALAAAVEAARREGYKAGWNDREGDLLAGIDRVCGAAAQPRRDEGNGDG